MQAVYEKTGGTDGMVSLEVSPDIAHDSNKTVAEALDLYRRVARENLMIKIPATLAGIDSIRRLTAEGVNVNATLIFSPERYRQTLEAYIDGLKERVAGGQSIDLLRSVASFFVSRVDSKIDSLLADEHADLRGRAAIANAQMAYSHYLERISHDDWLDLAKKGAAVQRLLWASTGTKNPAYSDVRYVELLIGRDTVNTIPPATYAAYKDHGRAEETLLRHIDRAPQLLQQITDAGIDWAQLYVELEAEGLAGFEKAFSELLATLTAKIKTLHRAAEQQNEAAASGADGDSAATETAAAPESGTTGVAGNDGETPAGNAVAEAAHDAEDVAEQLTTADDAEAPSAETTAIADDHSGTPAADTTAETENGAAETVDHAAAAAAENGAETAAESAEKTGGEAGQDDSAADAAGH